MTIGFRGSFQAEEPPSEARSWQARSWALSVARALAPQDWLSSAYVSVLALSVFVSAAAGRGPGPVLEVGLLWLAFTSAVLAVRLPNRNPGALVAFLYRLAQFGVLLVSYLLLSRILPLVNSGNLDSQLYQLDLLLFGHEPAVVLDRLVSPFWTEWFSFFYYSYFFLLGLHIFPILFFSRNEKLLREFSLGLIAVYSIGQTTYMLVPGFGPHLALTFENVLTGGFWHQLMLAAVNAGGAQKDIFPSLHTATPVFLTLFSFRYRHLRPFRYTWPLVGFFAFNIVFATMYLRWHWLIDVVAGLCLAPFALWLSVRLGAREAARRAALGLGDNWPHLDLRAWLQSLR